MPTRKVKKAEPKAVSGLSEFMGSSAENKKIIKRYGAKEPDMAKKWYTAPEEGIYGAIDAAITMLEQAQSTRRMLNIKFARLYSNMEAIGFPYSNLMKSSPENATNNRITLNIVQSVIDAVGAKVAKDQPKVSFVTTGADDYFLKMRAFNLTKYMQGLFKEAEVYENSEKVFRDACVIGTGHLFLYQEDGKLKTKWCAPDEIRVDELDAMEQKPRSMFRVYLMSKDQLAYKYPDKKEEILSSGTALQGKVTMQSITEMTRVVEAWHLPSGPDADDGVHAICTDNTTLFYEKYEKDYFPVVPFRWYHRPLGYFGRSITEEIMTIQVEINKYLRTIQQCHELAAVPIIFVPNEAEIAEDVLLSNFIARMVPFSGGNPPVIVTPEPIAPSVLQHLNSLIQWAFQTVGLSQTSASGMKPAGVDSAVAIREVADIETGRFAQVALRWEQFFVDVARVLVDMSKDLYTEQPELAVAVSEKKMLREIKWKDVDLKDNPYDIQTFPVSQLPDTPAGRIQTITEYIQNQWISKERGMELLNLDPDLEQEVNLQTSSLRLTEKWLSDMAEEGIYHKPEPFMNLPLAQQIAQGVYNQMVLDNLPEERLQLIRDFIGECIDMQQQPPPTQQPQAPQQQAPQPPAAGEPLPPMQQGQMPPMPPGQLPS